MKRTIELIERIIEGSRSSIEDNAYTLINSLGEWEFFRRFVFSCIEYLDRAASLQKLTGEGYEEAKEYVISKIDYVRDENQAEKYDNNPLWQAVKDMRGINIGGRIRVNMIVLEHFKKAINEDTHEEFWEGLDKEEDE